MSDKYTKKQTSFSDKETTSGSKGSQLNFSTSSDASQAWNSQIEKKIADAEAAGKTVYKGHDDKGFLHYTTLGKDDSRINEILDYYNNNDNATYNFGGKNYTWNPEVKQTPTYSADYSSMQSYIEQTLADQERIKSYYDEYLPAMMEGGKLAADNAYEANANAALNTRTEALRQQKENYIRNAMEKYGQLEGLRGDRDAMLDSVNSDYFAVLQQNRENSASRGLSNSGLMQALDQSIMAEANAQRASIDQQYYAQKNQLNKEISTLVETYGLNKAEADKIYNDTIQSLEQQRQTEYQRVVAEAQQKAIEYQFGVDSFNASAYNDAKKTTAQLVTDAWKTKVNSDTQITVAQIAADNNMSIAQLQDATDRWKAQLDSDDKKWVSQFDRQTQIQLATLDNESRERVAGIQGAYGLNAAKFAAQLEYDASVTGIKLSNEQFNKSMQFAIDSGAIEVNGNASDYTVDIEKFIPSF